MTISADRDVDTWRFVKYTHVVFDSILISKVPTVQITQNVLPSSTVKLYRTDTLRAAARRRSGSEDLSEPHVPDREYCILNQRMPLTPSWATFCIWSEVTDRAGGPCVRDPGCAEGHTRVGTLIVATIYL